MENENIERIVQRDITFDVMKGIGVMLVMIGHCFSGIIESFVYSFHIPFFFILSGFFWKQRSLRDDLRKNARRLLFPAYATLILCLIISICLVNVHNVDIPKPKETFDQLLYCYAGPIKTQVLGGGVSTLGHVWFLFGLFWAKSIYNCFASYVRNGNIGIICLVLSLISIYLGRYVNLPWCIMQGMDCVFFFAIGVETRKHDVLGRIKNNMMLFILLLSWVAFIPYSKLNVYSLEWNHIPIVNFYTAIIGTLFFYLLCRWLVKKSYVISKVCAKIGYYSLFLLCILTVKNLIPQPWEIGVDERINFLFSLCWKTTVLLLLFIILMRIRIVREIFKI